MFSTNFDSPHGLINKFNYSTAYDMAVLTGHCMRYSLFRKIVKTGTYRAYPRNRECTEPPYIWENTNKLLETELTCTGCKTGITETAGPCFSGVFE
jgi:D-alanyl-D-alanine carboxypeptidase